MVRYLVKILFLDEWGGLLLGGLRCRLVYIVVTLALQSELELRGILQGGLGFRRRLILSNHYRVVLC